MEPKFGFIRANSLIHLIFIEAWSKVTAAERSKCLRKWYDLLMAHKEELGQLMTLEQGKPLKEAIGEVPHFNISSLQNNKIMFWIFFLGAFMYMRCIGWLWSKFCGVLRRRG